MSFDQNLQIAKPEKRIKCTLIPGDGVGPELVYSVQEVFKVSISLNVSTFDLLSFTAIFFCSSELNDCFLASLFVRLFEKAANVPVDFETFFFSEINPVLSSKLEDVRASIQKNKICLKVKYHQHLFVCFFLAKYRDSGDSV